MAVVLVTGGGSFIGGHLVGRLVADGHDVATTLRHHDDATARRLRDVGVRILVGDLANPNLLRNFDLDPGVIVHAAATSSPQDSKFAGLFSDNALVTRNVVDMAYATGCRHLIGLSSVSVHGTVLGGTLTEDTGFRDPNEYGLSKRVGELLMSDAADDMRVSLLRLPGVVGAAAGRHWLATTVALAAANHPIVMHHPSAMFNNVVHVDDLCGFVARIVVGDGSGAAAFPLASRDPIAIRDVVTTLVKALGSASAVFDSHVDSDPFVIDDSLARDAFGYQSMTTRDALLRFCQDVSGYPAVD